MNASEPTFRREAIRELMEREGLNASRFASKASVQRTLIGGWLAGVVTPQVGTLGRLCRVFNVPITFFFDEGPSEAPSESGSGQTQDATQRVAS